MTQSLSPSHFQTSGSEQPSGICHLAEEVVTAVLHAVNHVVGALARFNFGETLPANDMQQRHLFSVGVGHRLNVARDVNSGGPGAWEAVIRYSEVDLNDARISGGDLSRTSIGLNWYPTSDFKLTTQYGWIDLYRFGKSSTTKVFQFRLALLLGM